MRPDGAPDDYDPTGYYARKAKSRAEMEPFLDWIWLLALGMVLFAAAINFFDHHRETLMFGLNLTTLIIGILIGLVLVQLYPPSARIGVWLVNKGRAAWTWFRNR